jgi:hypothetical protein
LQSHVTDEENTRSHAEHAVAESQITRHAQRRIGYASAVKIICDVKDEKKGKQSYGNMVPSEVRNLKRSRCDRA